MRPDQALAFAAFALVAAGTPGPSNTLLMTIGARVGVIRGAPALLGQAAGMAVMLFVVSLGVGTLVLAQPVLLGLVRWSGVVFLLWLAWRIGSSRAHVVAQGDARPLGLLGMAAFQWLNPKAWLVATSAAATYADATADPLIHAAVAGVIFFGVALLVCSPWLAFGAVIQRFLRSERSMRVFNIVMGALLAVSVVPLLFE